MDSVEDGRNWITYSGHGYTGGWAGPDMTTNDVHGLNDPTSMPFVLGFACDTGDYRPAETFAEVWQRNPNGAILYWGSVDSSYWDPDDILEKRLYDGIFAGKREIADILDHALSEHYAHFGGGGFSKYYWESYTAFTDPTITLRTGLPE